MAAASERPRATRADWQSVAWPEDERGWARLVEALASDRLELEAVNRELVATSRVDPADLADDRRVAERAGLADARRELGMVRAALHNIAQRSPAGGEVAYDAADEDEDQMADALVQYLVRTGYADVRTEEPEPGHYVYHIQVDWPKLRALAAEHGLTL